MHLSEFEASLNYKASPRTPTGRQGTESQVGILPPVYNPSTCQGFKNKLGYIVTPSQRWGKKITEVNESPRWQLILQLCKSNCRQGFKKTSLGFPRDEYVVLQPARKALKSASFPNTKFVRISAHNLCIFSSLLLPSF